MKKWMFYLGGLVTGIVLSLVVSFSIKESPNKMIKTKTEKEAQIEHEKKDDVTYFNEPGEIFEETKFHVFQVVAKNAALVTAMTSELDLFGTTFAIYNREGEYYYDNEIITVPKGKVARQMGIYQYRGNDGIIKTVPVIEIVDNK